MNVRRRHLIVFRLLIWGLVGLACLALVLIAVETAAADGKVVRPRDYHGSLEESAQEAIIVFNSSEREGEAIEDLILKITVTGSIDQFAWVIPFPNAPKTKREDPKLFKELFQYVQARQIRSGREFGSSNRTDKKSDKAAGAKPVDLLSREIVGNYDVAVVKENEAGALNEWLKKEGFQPLEKSDDVVGFYRDKGYLFACIKVDEAKLDQNKTVDMHPLRFTFKTGGRDGIYFPMRMTGLQSEPFDVNLYVFYRAWLNDDLNKFGYVHRGFHLVHRDWDTRACVANGGKAFSAPKTDPYLKSLAHQLPTVAGYFQKLHPGEKYYLTNIQARNLQPEEVREWTDDLWMFPHYTDRSFVPYDVRDRGVASAAWPNETAQVDDNAPLPTWAAMMYSSQRTKIGIAAIAVALAAMVGCLLWRRHASTCDRDEMDSSAH